MTIQQQISIPTDQILQTNYACVKYMDYLVDRNIEGVSDSDIALLKELRDIFAAAHLQDVPAEIPFYYTRLVMQAMFHFLPSIEEIERKSKSDKLTEKQKEAYYFQQLEEQGYYDEMESCPL